MDFRNGSWWGSFLEGFQSQRELNLKGSGEWTSLGRNTAAKWRVTKIKWRQSVIWNGGWRVQGDRGRGHVGREEHYEPCSWASWYCIRARTLAKWFQRPPDNLKFDISSFHNLSKARYVQCGKNWNQEKHEAKRISETMFLLLFGIEFPTFIPNTQTFPLQINLYFIK